MSERSGPKPPAETLASLGLREIEERLEVSPLLTPGGADDVEGDAAEGHSCTCKIQPQDPEEDDPGGDW